MDQNTREYVTHWRTREGELLLPSEMETSHLLNSLNMMIRRVRGRLIRHALNLYNDSVDENLPKLARHARWVAGMAYDNNHCRGMAIATWPVALEMEREYLRRIHNQRFRKFGGWHNFDPYGA